ncbi:MAG: tetratricopeptide repeat protein [Candidatus Marinimicrobia bacterium]|nr:tetratricopeptide repeat protein [Candidatus Neomarinimicrobiota bacterium]MBL7023492.1 tetratricopeptide repeat protein [Candidatus Neomarinimicrobiota bacterium]MBL7109549.1 tetratricopeptide repeat protein [Candidatus Neomarinimicrobiota bacterium]
MTKKSDLKHDPIREYIVKAISFTNDYKNRIVQVSIGIIVILFAVYWLKGQAEQKEENAATSFGIALNSYIEAGSDSLKRSVALADFQEVVDNYESSKAGNYSKFYLAKEHFDNANYNEASILLNQIKSKTDDIVLQSYILNMLGNIASNNGEVDKAIQHYLKAAKLVQVDALSDNFKVNAIRAYIVNQQFDKAILILESLLEKDNLKYTVKNEIEMLLAEAEYLSNN